MIRTVPLLLALLAGPLAAQPRAADLAGVARETGRFSTLLRALGAAGLLDELRGAGPLTLLAPTDGAFAALPDALRRKLLHPDNREQLRDVLRYHLVPGRLRARDLAGVTSLTTLQGQRVPIGLSEEGAVLIEGQRVVLADREAHNGILHGIDSLLVPQFLRVEELLRQDGRFGTLLRLLRASGSGLPLGSPGAVTLLAPTDAAFAALSGEARAELLTPAGRPRLRAILKHHLLAGRVRTDQAVAAGEVETTLGTALGFRVRKGRLQAGGAALLETDREAFDGVLHVVDRVLMPPARALPPSGPLVLGIRTAAPSEEVCAVLGLDPQRARLIVEVSPGSGAREAGLRRLDLLVGVDGRPGGLRDLEVAKRAAGAGGKVTLEVIRAGRRLRRQVEVRVAARR